MRLFALIASVLITTIVAASVATAHTRRPSGTWYFDGMTYKKNDPTVREDPVNFIFAPGPADTSLYTRDRIEEHMDDDWNHRAIGGRSWRRDAEINPWCKDDQRMYWENVTERTSDKTDWHGSTSRVAGYCGNQHHARFWDDQEHARQTGDHGPEDQWAVGGIHHERVDDLGFAGHVIDRDWDHVRREMVRAMGAHCSETAWRYHPDADSGAGKIEGWGNFGFIARISLRHQASGSCEGW